MIVDSESRLSYYLAVRSSMFRESTYHTIAHLSPMIFHGIPIIYPLTHIVGSVTLPLLKVSIFPVQPVPSVSQDGLLPTKKSQDTPQPSLSQRVIDQVQFAYARSLLGDLYADVAISASKQLPLEIPCQKMYI